MSELCPPPSPTGSVPFYRLSEKDGQDDGHSTFAAISSTLAINAGGHSPGGGGNSAGCLASFKAALRSLRLRCRRAVAPPPPPPPPQSPPRPQSPRKQQQPQHTQQANAGAPAMFPEWTLSELETLITRWTCTHPGPATHPQNTQIAALIGQLDSATATPAAIATLHASLLHRLKMDHHIELLASEIGLAWCSNAPEPSASLLPLPLPSSPLSPRQSAPSSPRQSSSPPALPSPPSTAPPSPAPSSAAASSSSTRRPMQRLVQGIEDFEPPPGRALSTAARRLLLGCRGEWKEAVMPLPPPAAVRMRYRKPKYWIVAVAAACGLSSAQLDAKMAVWFAVRGADGLFA